ncbi:MAG: DUF4157 domain-containing protein [Anaerolineae bacterium]|nr:DUF4157 domain-containing protein [Anaerolineae bacterium]
MSDLNHDSELIRKRQHAQKAEPENTPQADINPVTRLQRMIGNRAVSRMMLPGGGTVQAKMNVTAADDAQEREADAMAEHAMRSINDTSAQPASVQREGEEDEVMAKRIQREGDEDEMMAKRIQRQGPEDEELQMQRIQRDDEEEDVQAKRIQREGDEDELAMKRAQRSAVDMSGAFSVGDEFESQLNNARGGGSYLDDSTRGKMEGAFGADFSGVRVHTGSQSDALNRSIGARAFTTGSDIFFKSGEYNPGSSDGQRLLAHELTHTVHQGAVRAKREEKRD